MEIKEIRDKDDNLVKKIIIPGSSMVLAISVELNSRKIILSNANIIELENLDEFIDCLSLAKKIALGEA